MDLNYNCENVNVNETKNMSFLERFVGIFVSPKKVFADVKKKSKILIPMLFLIVISVITMYIGMPIVELTQEKIGNLVYELYQIDMSQMQGAMSANQTTLGILGAPISMLLSLLFSVIFLWIFSKMFGGSAKFKDIFNLKVYVSLLTYTGGLLATIIQVLINTDVSVFSLAVFMPNGNMSSFLYDILYSINLFELWGAIITGIGLALVNNFSKVKGYVVSFIVFVLGVIFSACSLHMVFWTYDLLSKKGLM